MPLVVTASMATFLSKTRQTLSRTCTLQQRLRTRWQTIWHWPTKTGDASVVSAVTNFYNQYGEDVYNDYKTIESAYEKAVMAYDKQAAKMNSTTYATEAIELPTWPHSPAYRTVKKQPSLP